MWTASGFGSDCDTRSRHGVAYGVFIYIYLSYIRCFISDNLSQSSHFPVSHLFLLVSPLRPTSFVILYNSH